MSQNILKDIKLYVAYLVVPIMIFLIGIMSKYAETFIFSLGVVYVPLAIFGMLLLAYLVVFFKTKANANDQLKNSGKLYLHSAILLVLILMLGVLSGAITTLIQDGLDIWSKKIEFVYFYIFISIVMVVANAILSTKNSEKIGNETLKWISIYFTLLLLVVLVQEYYVALTIWFKVFAVLGATLHATGLFIIVTKLFNFFSNEIKADKDGKTDEEFPPKKTLITYLSLHSKTQKPNDEEIKAGLNLLECCLKNNSPPTENKEKLIINNISPNLKVWDLFIKYKLFSAKDGVPFTNLVSVAEEIEKYFRSPWEMTLRGISYHIDKKEGAFKGPLQHIIIFCSSGENGKSSLLQVEHFIYFLQNYFSIKKIKMKLSVVIKQDEIYDIISYKKLKPKLDSDNSYSFNEVYTEKQGLDFGSDKEVFTALNSVLQKLALEQNIEDVVIDVTGGTKVTSLGAILSTTLFSAFNQYVNTNEPKNVIGYDFKHKNVAETGG